MELFLSLARRLCERPGLFVGKSDIKNVRAFLDG